MQNLWIVFWRSIRKCMVLIHIRWLMMVVVSFVKAFVLCKRWHCRKRESRWWVPAFTLIDVVRHLYRDLREEQSLSLHFVDFTKRPWFLTIRRKFHKKIYTHLCSSFYSVMGLLDILRSECIVKMIIAFQSTSSESWSLMKRRRWGSCCWVSTMRERRRSWRVWQAKTSQQSHPLRLAPIRFDNMGLRYLRALGPPTLPPTSYLSTQSLKYQNPNNINYNFQQYQPRTRASTSSPCRPLASGWMFGT